MREEDEEYREGGKTQEVERQDGGGRDNSELELDEAAAVVLKENASAGTSTESGDRDGEAQCEEVAETSETRFNAIETTITAPDETLRESQISSQREPPDVASTDLQDTHIETEQRVEDPGAMQVLADKAIENIDVEDVKDTVDEEPNQAHYESADDLAEYQQVPIKREQNNADDRDRGLNAANGNGVVAIEDGSDQLSVSVNAQLAEAASDGVMDEQVIGADRGAENPDNLDTRPDLNQDRLETKQYIADATEKLAELISDASSRTVTVSTDAWLALRHERTQRERQIKALQSQVAAAQQELRELDQVRAQLRQQRSLALEARSQRDELHESVGMAAEDLAALNVEQMLAAAQAAKQPPPGGDERQEDELNTLEAVGPEPVEEHTSSMHDIQHGENQQMGRESEEQRQASLEWQRLLHERETTAQELGLTLRRVEEMEQDIEERRIQLQIAERRRERERRSLLTALRELGGRRTNGKNGNLSDREFDDLEDEPDALGGAARQSPFSQSPSCSASPSTLPSSGSRSPGVSQDDAREWQYLERISELEEAAAKLQSQIDAVEARVATLNRRAATRQEALRYATATSVTSFAGRVGLGSGLGSPGTGRSDLDSLTEMLDRLFVENFALRGRSGGVHESVARSMTASDPAHAPMQQSTRQPPPLDLSRFVVGAGVDSDEEPAASSVSHGKSVANHSADLCASSTPWPVAPLPATPGTTASRPSSGTTTSRPSSPPSSPRTRLFGGLDFKALSVAE
eukprot:TRINITY_DN27449_c0_g1_i2.p1 TRINITY_DN27449_c0_g1~~TRINITY_DN27449_c0_g1_i2.p1  ORF type:complete len:752 (+),score=131.60 TRINITY_DN27449_c0_g1_i2:275-2530(+)